MSTKPGHISGRISDFAKQLTFKKLKKTQIPLYIISSLVTFYAFIYVPTSGFQFLTLIAVSIAMGYLAREVIIQYRPPGEIIVGCLLITYYFLTKTLEYAFYGQPGFNFFLEQLLIIVLAFTFISIAILIIESSKENQKRSLLTYVFIGFIALSISAGGADLPIWVSNLFIFIYLLRKTAWLEKLTKLECWTYLLIFIGVFKLMLSVAPLADDLSLRSQDSLLWYGLSWLAHTTIRLYVLSILIKIPVVLVYNFASLSRKLRISSLFQSTFPQIIQLCMLLIIFYFSMAGWQAEKVRKALLDTMEMIRVGEISKPEYWAQADFVTSGELTLPGYETMPLDHRLPKRGIILLQKTSGKDYGQHNLDYFLFHFKPDSLSSIELTRLDNSFFKLVAKNTSVLAGSKLFAYPYEQATWESYLFETLTHVGVSSDSRRFHIFPFSIVPQTDSPRLSVNLDNRQEDPGTNLFDYFTEKFLLTIGRVVTPTLNNKLEESNFLAFDIVMAPSLALFTKTLVSYLLFLIIIYGLVNITITRRMVQFGMEINSSIIQKFNQLRNGIRAISKGNLDYKVKIEGRDEFTELAERFNLMGERLKDSIVEAREKERLAHELAIARQVQLDLLPRVIPQMPGFDIAATLQTATEVGGDFYDIIPLDENRCLFTIGDVSGKGTSAAFYMAQFVSLARYSPSFTDKPDEIVSRINRYFSGSSVDKQVFVTAIIGVLDASKHTVQFVRAGHTSPFLVPADPRSKIKELKSKGIGIGLTRDGALFEKNIALETVKLEVGDSLVFHTDGIEEAARKNDELNTHGFYGAERLLKVIEKSRAQMAVQTIKLLQNDINSFYDGMPLVDDYTALVMRRTSK